jgi:hypothetical protein
VILGLFLRPFETEGKEEEEEEEEEGKASSRTMYMLFAIPFMANVGYLLVEWVMPGNLKDGRLESDLEGNIFWFGRAGWVVSDEVGKATQGGRRKEGVEKKSQMMVKCTWFFCPGWQ